MKILKKTSVFAILFLFICTSIIGAAHADESDAAQVKNTSGEFTYQMMSPGEGVEITGYRGISTIVEIPGEIEGGVTTNKGCISGGLKKDEEVKSNDSDYKLKAEFAMAENSVIVDPQRVIFNKNNPRDFAVNINWGTAQYINGITGEALGGVLLITLQEHRHYDVREQGEGKAILWIKQTITELIPVPINMVPDGTEINLTIEFNNGETGNVTMVVVGEAPVTDSALSVSIDNHPDARPQWGLNEAEMVYETTVAPGITRFLAVYDLQKQINKIGPVRSAREHLVQLAAGHKGAFAHCGGSSESLNIIPYSSLIDFDEIYNSPSYFYRENHGQNPPYNLYTNTQWIKQGIEDRGLIIRESLDFIRGNMPGGQTESLVSVKFPGQNYNVEFAWNEQNHNYERKEKGNQIAAGDGSIITAKNIVVIYVPHEQIYKQDIKEWVINPVVNGSGKAHFYRDSKSWSGQWNKYGMNAPMSFSVDNDPYKFAPGNIWVLVVPKNYYEVELVSGWNTLSIPLKLEKDKVGEIIDADGIIIIYAYNATTKRWVEVGAEKPLNPMDALYIKTDSDNYSAKLLPYQELSIGYTHQIKKGWNLIGPALDIGSANGSKMEVNRVLASLDNKYSQVISQSIGNQPGWVYVNGDYWNTPYMHAGKGYWVYALEDGELAGFSSTPVNAIYDLILPGGGGPGGGGGAGGVVLPTDPDLIPGNDLEIPEFPAAFYGSVNYENGDIVPAGTIDVIFDEEVIASKSFSDGQYGLALGERLIIEQLYFDFADSIQFKVNGRNAVAEEIIDWSGASGKLMELNFIVSQHQEPLGYQYIKVKTANLVEVSFNKTIVNNLESCEKLKETILFTDDGMNYHPLTENDTVEINDNKLIITFEQNLTGNENQIKIAADTLKDIEGNVISKEILTDKFAAEVIDECFIATAAFGSKLNPAVNLLRQFRDTKLLTNKSGTAFVNYYYAHSPKIAETITKNDKLKMVVRILLIPVIAMTWMVMNYKITLAVLVLLLLVYYYKIRRNRIRVIG